MKNYLIAALLVGVTACSSGEGEKASTQNAAPAKPAAAAPAKPPAAAPPAAKPAAPQPVPTGKGSPAYTLENNLEDFWSRADGGAKDNLRPDHEACQAAAPKQGPALLQLKGYIDCMGGKGWKQEADAWKKLGEKSAAQAGQ